MRSLLNLIVLLSVLAVSCKKYEDKQGTGDERLNKPYCNDPEAVNFNWDFPGKPDNTTCFYPYEVFEGSYLFKDSSYYSEDYVFGYYKEYTFKITRDASSKTKLLISGFCGDPLRFTADRFYKATADSSKLSASDTTKLKGQIVCNPTDTLSGYIIRQKTDSSLAISFTVFTDTGVVYHTGKAIKQ